MRGCLVCLLLLSGCRRPDPDWSKLPSGTNGDATVQGTPASVRKLASHPIIDGKLDDAAWSAAAVLGPLVDPGAGGPARADHPVAASARIGWDDTHLYLGLVVRDGKASSTFARDAVDPHIWGSASGIELMLQPGDPGDNRDYYEVQVDVNGAIWDTRFDDYNAPTAGSGAERTFGHQEWQSKLERAVFQQPGGFYSVELALPWSSLRAGRSAIPPRAGDVWRLNLYTFRDGQRQALAWSPLLGKGNFHKAERFGRVRFESAGAGKGE
jgi:hypothetical protein